MKIVTFVVVVALSCIAFQGLLRGQEGKEGAKGKERAASSIQAVAKAAKVRIDKAIGIALEARPGTAVGVELEGSGEGDKVAPVFEVMVLGKDNNVYEVFVDAVAGSVIANKACDDEEDVEEVQHAMAGEGSRLPLAALVTEARAVLRGNCVQAGFDAKGKRVKTVFLNRDRRLVAEWNPADGELVEVSWLDGRSKKADDDDDDEEDEGKGEKGEQGEGSEGSRKRENKGKHDDK